MTNANTALQALLEGVIGGLVERNPEALNQSRYRVSVESRNGDYLMRFWDRQGEGAGDRFVYQGIYDLKPTQVWYNWEDGALKRIRENRFEIPLNPTTSFNLSFGVKNDNGTKRIVLLSAKPVGFLDDALIMERKHHETSNADTDDPAD